MDLLKLAQKILTTQNALMSYRVHKNCIFSERTLNLEISFQQRMLILFVVSFMATIEFFYFLLFYFSVISWKNAILPHFLVQHSSFTSTDEKTFDTIKKEKDQHFHTLLWYQVQMVVLFWSNSITSRVMPFWNYEGVLTGSSALIVKLWQYLLRKLVLLVFLLFEMLRAALTFLHFIAFCHSQSAQHVWP